MTASSDANESLDGGFARIRDPQEATPISHATYLLQDQEPSVREDSPVLLCEVLAHTSESLCAARALCWLCCDRQSPG